jgi:prefoldin subunit 5
LDTQRQIDDLKKSYSDLYSPRDALTNLQRRLEDVERRLALAQQQAQEAQRPR